MSSDLFNRAKHISVYSILSPKITLNQKGGNHRYYDGPCPECGGKDRFWIDTRKNTCCCRQCGFGGDAVGAWAQLRHIGMKESALELLGESEPPKDWKPKIAVHTPKPPPSEWKGDQWQSEAASVIKGLTKCNQNNPGGKYLDKRGIMDAEIIELYQIKYDAKRFSKADDAQLPAIMIPWIYGDKIVNIRYRFTDPQKTRFNSKYGGNPIVFGTNVPCTSTRANLTEGELNAISIKVATPNYHAWSVGSQYNTLGIEAAIYEAKQKGVEEILVWFDEYKYAKIAKDLIEEAGIKCGMVCNSTGDLNDWIVEYGKEWLAETASKAFASIGREVDEWEEKARERTDYMNGVRLIRKYGDEFRRVVETEQFSTWNGHKWAIDLLGESKVRDFAVETAKEYQASAKLEDHENTRKAIRKWAIESLGTSKLNNAIKEAGSMKSTSLLEYDKQPWLLNTKNGIVNLRNGELKPHDRNLLLSQVTGTRIAPIGSPGPEVFINFMARIVPDEDTRKFLFQYLSYCLTGITTEQCYVFFHGNTGNNGKSTLMNIMQYILGDYSMTLDVQVLMQAKGVQNNDYELARLRGKRFAAVNEVSEMQALNEALVKQLTGGDHIKAREIFGRPFEFPTIAKIAMTGNNRPKIIGQDQAIWRRVNLVPFEVEVPKSERDPYLGEKLKAEAPLILRFLVDWCLRWQATGLERSPIMIDERERYQKDNDPLGTFIEECVIFEGSTRTKTSTLYEKYSSWCKRNGFHAMTSNNFSRNFQERTKASSVEKMKTGGNYCWLGITIFSEENGDDYEDQSSLTI